MIKIALSTTNFRDTHQLYDCIGLSAATCTSSTFRVNHKTSRVSSTGLLTVGRSLKALERYVEMLVIDWERLYTRSEYGAPGVIWRFDVSEIISTLVGSRTCVFLDSGALKLIPGDGDCDAAKHCSDYADSDTELHFLRNCVLISALMFRSVYVDNII